MVKTRSDLKGVRVSAKAPRKMPSSTPVNSPGGRSSRKYDGGNTYCPREVPVWQKEITNFFTPKASSDNGNCSSDPDTGTSSSQSTSEN